MKLITLALALLVTQVSSADMSDRRHLRHDDGGKHKIVNPLHVFEESFNQVNHGESDPIRHKKQKLPNEKEPSLEKDSDEKDHESTNNGDEGKKGKLVNAEALFQSEGNEEASNERQSFNDKASENGYSGLPVAESLTR